jgi:hypothetical protein
MAYGGMASSEKRISLMTLNTNDPKNDWVNTGFPKWCHLL